MSGTAEERDARIHLAWQRVAKQIPSKHISGARLERAWGFRFWLAQEAATRSVVRYLEIGCRRGHSFALTCLAAGDRLEKAIAIDPWIAGYGGEPNAGADQVRADLRALGIDIEKTSFLTGNSHEILPIILDAQHESGGASFNLILVDGDHSRGGARRDLDTAIELLEPGGMIVFDDTYPESEKPESGLLEVWRAVMRDNQRISAAGEELQATPPFCWASRGA